MELYLEKARDLAAANARIEHLVVDLRVKSDENVTLRARASTAEASLAEAKAEIERLRKAIRTVHDTFAKDIAQGYRSRDGQYAVTILGKALSPPQQAGGNLVESREEENAASIDTPADTGTAVGRTRTSEATPAGAKVQGKTAAPPQQAGNGAPALCGDCPPVGYETDRTRCLPCPRRQQAGTEAQPPAEVKNMLQELKTALQAGTEGGK